MTIRSDHKQVTLQSDFPVPCEYFQYFYKPSLLEQKQVPFGFIFNDTTKVKITQILPFWMAPDPLEIAQISTPPCPTGTKPFIYYYKKNFETLKWEPIFVIVPVSFETGKKT